MDENTKKRRRKTKLVPREYLDSDDENIAQMQNEIEETIAKMNPRSILKKLETKTSTKPLEFSVKIEVEEFNEPEQIEVPEAEEVKPTEEIKPTEEEANTEESKVKTPEEQISDVNEPSNMNIKIKSITSLSVNHTSLVSLNLHYKISDEVFRQEFEALCQETTEQADKLIEIHIKNMFGRKQMYLPQSDLDEQLQAKLKRWRSWYLSFPNIREAPTMYLCHVCDIGFWHFYQFREHVAHHDQLIFRVDTQNHDFRLTCNNGSNVERRRTPEMSDCWKCGKDVKFHLGPQYKCEGCDKRNHNCTLLMLHESVCEAYKEIYKKSGGDTSVMYKCPICPYKYWEEQQIRTHLELRHVVRSDLPTDWVTKHCSKCSMSYQDYRVHECEHRPVIEQCDYCMKKFQSKPALALHLSNSKINVQCRVCQTKFKRGCMETEHLLEHTKNYVMLYKCLYCIEPRYFLDFPSITDHALSTHLEFRKLFFDKVIMPRTLLKKIDPIINGMPDISNINNAVPSTAVNFDKACQGLIGYLDTKKAIRETIYDANYKQEPNSPFDAELGVQVTIISKNIARELLDATKADLKARKICNKFAKELFEKSDVMKVNRTYVNKRKLKKEIKETEAIDRPKVKIEPTEVEIVDSEVAIKEESIDIEETVVVNGEVKSELNIDTEVNNDDLNYQFRVKEECDDETDIISWKSECIDGQDNYERNEESQDETEQDPADVPRKLARSTVLPLKSVTNKYTCTKCNTSHQTMRKYLYHFRNHNFKKNWCPKCFKRYSWPQNLISHVNSHIKNNFVMTHAIKDRKVETKSNYQCRKCKETLGVADFFQHWESHLEIQYVGVAGAEAERSAVDMESKPLLKEMLAILQDLDSSDSSAEDWKLRMCVVCEKRFERRNDCKRHYIEHLLSDAYADRHKNGFLMCQICGMGFQKGDGYKGHMRDHASLPIYECEICNKRFSDSSNFCKHKKVHNLAVLICDICKKKFNNKTSLIRHMQFHEIMKPIDCDTCDKLFYSLSSYNKHLKKNRSRFKCPVCSTYYTSLKEKWDHMWLAHKERKYEADCPICKQSFRKFLDVKRHIRDEHNGNNYVYYKSVFRQRKPKKKGDDAVATVD